MGKVKAMITREVNIKILNGPGSNNGQMKERNREAIKIFVLAAPWVPNLPQFIPRGHQNCSPKSIKLANMINWDILRIEN